MLVLSPPSHPSPLPPIAESKPLWAQRSSEVKDEEYKEFFKQTFREFVDPLAWNHFSVEGTYEFKGLIYVPGMAPFEQVTMVDTSVDIHAEHSVMSRHTFAGGIASNPATTPKHGCVRHSFCAPLTPLTFAVWCGGEDPFNPPVRQACLHL